MTYHSNINFTLDGLAPKSEKQVSGIPACQEQDFDAFLLRLTRWWRDSTMKHIHGRRVPNWIEEISQIHVCRSKHLDGDQYLLDLLLGLEYGRFLQW